MFGVSSKSHHCEGMRQKHLTLLLALHLLSVNAVHVEAFLTFPAGASTISRRTTTTRCLPSSTTTRVLGGLDSTFDHETEDALAQSEFGTKYYWDEMYDGRGHFDAEQYSWYFGWETLQPHWTAAIQSLTGSGSGDFSREVRRTHRIFLPGIGNDSDLLCHLYNAGWTDITAMDYSENAIEKQYDNLSFMLPPEALMDDTTTTQNRLGLGHKGGGVKLHTMDLRQLDDDDSSLWTDSFDIALEKGALDAIFLSCESEDDIDNLQRSADELYRVVRQGGILISVSGVVPEAVRQQLFPTSKWEWMRDGSADLKAGCFLLRKKAMA
jgi:SAM-dependent methyltransferase